MLCDNQHGFLYAKSCVTNLIETFDIITDALSEGWDVVTVFLDFSKAFDKVSHQLLLIKLKAYGFGDVVIDWVRAFLINRKQRVVIGSSASDWQEVVSGVPQGSVLGPLLFLIFINDMPGLVHHFCKLFADDTKLIAIIKNSSDKILLQKDIDALVNWSNIWKISFNEEKGKAMFIGGKKFDTLNSAFIWPEDSSDPNLDTDPHDRHCRFKMNDSILGETITE